MALGGGIDRDEHPGERHHDPSDAPKGEEGACSGHDGTDEHADLGGFAPGPVSVAVSGPPPGGHHATAVERRTGEQVETGEYCVGEPEPEEDSHGNPVDSGQAEQRGPTHANRAEADAHQGSRRRRPALGAW